MSDRVAVMNHAVLQQVGRPVEVYDRPVNGFVAGFIGTSNLMPGVVLGDRIDLGEGLSVPRHGDHAGLSDGDRVTLSVRPERVALGSDLEAGQVQFSAEVSDVIFLGATTHVAVRLPGGRRLVAIHTHARGETIERGDRVQVGWWPEEALLLRDGPAAPVAALETPLV